MPSHDFFTQNDLADHGEGLFEHIEGFLYFVKDTQFRFVALNQRLVDQLGCQHAQEAIGKTDYDFFPPSMADAYAKDDRAILETGRPLLNKVELVPRSGGFVDWSTTTKIPLKSPDGSIKAIAGATRPFASGTSGIDIDRELGPALKEMKRNFAGLIKIPQLAQQAGLSLSAFERKFKKVFHMTPRAYIRHLRVHEACYLLSHSSHQLVEIAAQCGYSDQSHLSREFSRIMKKTPLTYRKSYRAR
ncbi:MAG: AraC family transcriptional regulator [Verrucomicrobiae bacterium]|nr:AraC family transcriptional regulator [Verrucomicrobiae bacterium]NNJ44318.1 AraC family transcriptional regulator [Akkermansiaceae bacterium]